MQLLQPLIALALLLGTSGRSTRSKWESQLWKADNVSLAESSEKLQGVFDAVITSMTQVRSGLESIRDSCVAQLADSAKRQQTQDQTIAALETTRQDNLAKTAGLEASLSRLLSQETDAHQSFESSVAQRADALKKHLSSSKATAEQAKVLGGALEMMKQKRDAIVAGQTSTDDFTAVPPVAPTSSGTGLDYVIGILTNMHDTLAPKGAEGDSKHNRDDADMEKLVSSYKTSLQHIDEQYQTENSRRMQAKVSARHAGEEKTLRAMLVDGEQKLDAKFVDLCGYNGKGGSVPASVEATDFLMSQLKQRSNNVLNTMDGLPDLVQSGATLFQLRGKVGIQPHVVSKDDLEGARVSAARWVISQAAKYKDDASQQQAKSVAASFPHGVPPLRKPIVHAAAPVDTLHAQVRATRRQQATKAVSAQAKEASQSLSKASADSGEEEDILKCVKDKQEVTDKIIASRQAARVARTDRMSSTALGESAGKVKSLAADQKVVLQSESSRTEAAFKSLRDLHASGIFTQDLSDAVSEMSSIEQDTQTYISAGGPPAAAGLPTALAGIKETLQAAQTRLTADMGTLDSTYSQSFLLSYSALINQLTSKVTSFETQAITANEAAGVADEVAKEKEQEEADLMIHRSGIEFNCLQNATCASLHFQQCCVDGAGTLTKSVGSWHACTDHCEDMIQKGHAVVGCEMVSIASDDSGSSGVCSAQTQCTIKASTSMCAGSLCKVSGR